MEKLDNLSNKRTNENDAEYSRLSQELNRSFAKLNQELDAKWFNEITGQYGINVIDPNEKKEEQIKEEQTVEEVVEEVTEEVAEEVAEDAVEENKEKEVKVSKVKKEKPLYKEKTVRNKDKKVGTIRLYSNGLKKTLLVASFIVVGTSAYIAGRYSNKKPVYQVCYNTLSTNYFDEPTYNGILYTVKSGDNLSSIIARYESDPNKQAAILSQMMSFNNLSSSRIINGEQIYLFGVPSSMLEEYGYSDNFNYFDPMVEINVRFEFLEHVIVSIGQIEEAQDYIQSVIYLSEWYKQFQYSYIPGKDDELNEIMNEVRELCEDAKQYGYDFDYNKKAMPLSEATNYHKEEGRTNN